MLVREVFLCIWYYFMLEFSGIIGIIRVVCCFCIFKDKMKSLRVVFLVVI